MTYEFEYMIFSFFVWYYLGQFLLHVGVGFFSKWSVWLAHYFADCFGYYIRVLLLLLLGVGLLGWSYLEGTLWGLLPGLSLNAAHAIFLWHAWWPCPQGLERKWWYVLWLPSWMLNIAVACPRIRPENEWRPCDQRISWPDVWPWNALCWL